MYVCVYIYIHICINYFFCSSGSPYSKAKKKKKLFKKVICCDKWKGGVQFNNCFPQSQWFLATCDYITTELGRLDLLKPRLNVQRSI